MLKRAFDIVASTAGLAIAGPLLLAPTAIATACHFRASPIYSVLRLGKDGKIYNMYKFRTMNDARDEAGAPLLDDQRITPFGRFLRRTSIDETPQLINILKGDMSVVGPRPYHPDEEEHIPQGCRIILSVQPGITGKWQVSAIGNPRKATPEERFGMDASYVRDGVSLWNDFRLMIKTIPTFYTGHDGECFEGTKPPALEGK